MLLTLLINYYVLRKVAFQDKYKKKYQIRVITETLE